MYVFMRMLINQHHIININLFGFLCPRVCSTHARVPQSHSSFLFREQNVSSQIHSRILVRYPRRFLRPPEPKVSDSDHR